MTLTRRTLVTGAIGAGVAVALPALAQTQNFPNKPIRWLVGSLAGGGMDLQTRIVADAMSKELGQPIIVENRAGAASAIAASALASSPADGYTLMSVDMGTYTLTPHLYDKLPYDPRRDFTMAGMVTIMPMMLVVSSSINVKTMPEFVAYVKSKPENSLNFASSGTGNPTHMAMELLLRKAGLKMTHVPYKGSPPAIADIAGGQITAMISDPNPPRPFVQTGRMRFIATVAPQRAPGYADVPTMKEAGFDLTLPVWVAIAVPKSTPRPVVDRINQSLIKAQGNQVVMQQLAAGGFILPESWSAKQTDDFAVAEYAQWGKTLAPMNIKLE